MANLLVEEPDALMWARPDLWEPWGGNDPGPPGPPALKTSAQLALVDSTTRVQRKITRRVGVGHNGH